MGTTKSRKTRRNTSRPTAFNFLSNIALGNEQGISHQDNNEPNAFQSHIGIQTMPWAAESSNKAMYPIPDADAGRHVSYIGAASLHSTDSSLSLEEHITRQGTSVGSKNQVTPPHASSFMTHGFIAGQDSFITKKLDSREDSATNRRRASLESRDSVQHHKLTREDSERPIASEKIKKKSIPTDKDYEQGGSGLFSVFRYYTSKIKQSAKKKSEPSGVNRGYLHQQLAGHDHHRHRKALSYAQFLVASGSLSEPMEETLGQKDSYDPIMLDNDSYQISANYSHSLNTSTPQMIRSSELKRELNEQFKLAHPEIPPEITLSKIRAIKLHLLEIGQTVDLEISTLAHAYVYFEKLVIKNVVTKKNRKLIAGCCLFLANKINEAKGTHCGGLLEAIDEELDVDADDVYKHEFAVFADLEFNLYIPRREFMPHMERILKQLEYTDIKDLIGEDHFYEFS
ncbi:uncharacterized protein BYT42DRAFT_573815 [Radiomyces spectabilis]|uniref:uncharacterized protein n=1 Tax=Radiomyces spectabilis TaxID=64574 RepID=UPI00221EEF39|nr:uncharacterized protein BYT42DRAFT_573815 [Radiomyces spectabilis]KAI8376218.1 hypothetical protein BYT42DRAFT_573815 [Radiomyces spectabilis]